MYLIIGLGNPGEKFKSTPHNVGFMVVDFLAVEKKFPEFKIQKKYKALISEKDDLILVKPQTFMNESGSSVKKIIQNSKFKIQNLVVIHDDIDLPLGKLKITKNSGAGGHKGVESIINQLGHKDFVRIKIGIATEDKKAIEVVLKKFLKDEQEIINGIVKKTLEVIDVFINEGLEKTMNKYNG